MSNEVAVHIATTHDYRDPTRCWGHDIHWKPGPNNKLLAGGWGYGLRVGDFLLLTNPDDGGETRATASAAICATAPIPRTCGSPRWSLRREEATVAENRPSEAAVRVAVGAASGDPAQLIRDALADAHDPERFEDPREVSVNLGAVLDAALDLETAQARGEEWDTGLHDHLLRRFGGDR